MCHKSHCCLFRQLRQLAWQKAVRSQKQMIRKNLLRVFILLSLASLSFPFTFSPQNYHNHSLHTTPTAQHHLIPWILV